MNKVKSKVQSKGFNPRSNKRWDSYSACGIAEGFDDPDGVFGTLEDHNIEAWAYLISTRLAWSLQGWYGRTAEEIIDGGSIDDQGHINWALVDNLKEE